MAEELAIFGGSPIRRARVRPVFHGSEKTRHRVDSILSGGILGDFYGGRWLGEFERSFSSAVGCSFAIGVNSGTAALHVAVGALGLGWGDEVLLPTACFFTAATAVLQEGATPVAVDGVPGSLEIDLEKAELALTSRTRAMIVAHMYGFPTDMSSVMGFAREHGLQVIEDACQSHGARYMGRFTGTIGDVGCFSFASPRKHIAVGEGGMVVTNSEEIGIRARKLANKGKANGWYTNDLMGYSYTMPEVSAVLGLQGLDELDPEVERRRRASSVYEGVFAGTEVEFDVVPANRYHSYFRKVVRFPDIDALTRDWIVRAIEAENVSAKPPHTPLHRIAWLARGSREGGVRNRPTGWHGIHGDYPVVDSEMPRTIDLETGPQLSMEDAELSALAVSKVWNWVRCHRREVMDLASAIGPYGS